MEKRIKEHPILFSAEMVRAILDGRKTQTRRVIKPQPEGKSMDDALGGEWLKKDFGGLLIPRIKDLHMGCPYQPGDRLWVRETWWHGDLLDDCGKGNVIEKGVYLYKADKPNIPGWPDC